MQIRSVKKRSPYTRIAFSNIVSHKRLYVPYMLACIGCTNMFYIMLFLVSNRGLVEIDSAALATVLMLGCIVIGLFSAVILYYANSFVIRRRKSEFGLYGVLGMERRHISRILLVETATVNFSSIGFGLLSGILLSKLILLFFAKVIRVSTPFGFELSPVAIGATIFLFTGIYAVIFVTNSLRIRFTSVLSMMKSRSIGEREPKSKRLIAIIGVITLAAGYGLALLVKNPSYAFALFFVAVILVIIATYCLFTAGSIGILKKMKKTPSFYYKAKNFVSTAGLLFRMKQNSAGLATICILSTMVLVMISTTTCLYAGVEDSLRNMHPRDMEIRCSYYDYRVNNCLNDRNSILDLISHSGADIDNLVYYRRNSYEVRQEGSRFIEDYDESISEIKSMIIILPVCDYNELHGTEIKLNKGETLVHSVEEPYGYDEVSIFECPTMRVVGALDEMNVDEKRSIDNGNVYYFVVADIETVATLHRENANRKGFELYIGFDTEPEFEQELDDLIVANMQDRLEWYREMDKEASNNSGSGIGFGYSIRSVFDERESYYDIVGGLFFLGMMLGTVFIMGAVLIMYYKQVSEGYEDRQRFGIMRKVGMSHDEVKKTIRSQVMIVFFLPLLTAGVHVVFAFPMITRLFMILNLTNVPLFVACTGMSFAVFSVLYYVVYRLTARTYYKIVCFE